MKTIFKKSNLELIKRVVHGQGVGWDNYDFYYKMVTEDGIARQVASELMLLQRGAMIGNVNSMIQLARHYYYDCCDDFLPHALSWWVKAIKTNFQFAKDDFNANKNAIFDRIINYQTHKQTDAFDCMVMKCAMLSEWFLTDFGFSKWKDLTEQERMDKIRVLTETVCPILQIPQTAVSFVPGLTYIDEDGITKIADGLAHWEGWIDVRSEILPDMERVIEVIFHELGHIAIFEMKKVSNKVYKLRADYGITSERANKWEEKHIDKTTMKPEEEDADTLSYNVYLNWAIFFAE